MLEPADKVEIRILVDNLTDVLSSNPSFVESEMASLGRRGIAFSARCLCCAAHGLSCLVTVHRAGKSHTVLFDSGPEDYVFQRNVTRLGVDLGVVESIVLSHGHWDHAGAMLLALSMVRGRNDARSVPFYAHPGMFVTRGLRLPSGVVRRMDDVPGVAELTDFGAEVVVTTEPRALLEGLFYVSGGKLVVFDYDSTNRQTLMNAGAAWTAVFAPDYKYVYALSPNVSAAGQFNLNQTALLTPSDL